MKIIEQYIAKQIIFTILLVSLCLLGIDLFFYLINEIRFVGTGNYDLSRALMFIAFTIPRKLYALFPWSALVGTLLALGSLAKDSELVAMRAATISAHRIAWASIKAACVLTIFITLLGEIVSPYSENYAQQQKTLAMSKGQAISTQLGIWVRSANEFIHVDSFLPDGTLQDTTRYRLDDKSRLKEITIAKRATLLKANEWVLEDVKGTKFSPLNVTVISKEKQNISALLDQKIIETCSAKHVERLFLTSLWQIIQSQSTNGLSTTEYERAFWLRIVQPFSIIVMVYLAVPFAFGALRSSSMGSKALIGILVGFSFHTLNAIFGPLTSVIDFPPILAALMPTSIFFLVGLWMMLRVK